MSEKLILALVTPLMMTLFFSAAWAGTLEDVKAKGAFSCGVQPDMPGLSSIGTDGQWSGFQVDFCRALAAAVFGNTAAATIVPVERREGYEQLFVGRLDILSNGDNRVRLYTKLDSDHPFSQPTVTLYDRQQMATNTLSGINSALELDGATICENIQFPAQSGSIEGTTTGMYGFRTTSSAYAEANRLYFSNYFVHREASHLISGLSQGFCDAYLDYAITLRAQIAGSNALGRFTVLPEIIAEAERGPIINLVEYDIDTEWSNVIKSVHSAMVKAEELGVTSTNVDQMRGSADAAVSELLGTTGNTGESLGLNNDWAYNIIKLVGNYGEVYDRNLGQNSALRIPRGDNNLVRNGGRMAAQ
jgi:general L-amino acid transport system substrate-binding protein